MYWLLLRNLSPYLESAKGTGTKATDTNARSDVAHPTPSPSYICTTKLNISVLCLDSLKPNDTYSGNANAARYLIKVQDDHADAAY